MLIQPHQLHQYRDSSSFRGSRWYSALFLLSKSFSHSTQQTFLEFMNAWHSDQDWGAICIRNQHSPFFRSLILNSLVLFLKNIFIVFERERERDPSMWEGNFETLVGYLLHAPYQGLNLQPGNMPWLGITPMTLLSMGWCSNWATVARANMHSLFSDLKYLRKWNGFWYICT